MAYVHYQKSKGNAAEEHHVEVGDDAAWNERVMAWAEVRFANLYPDYVIPATAVSYVFFFGIGGFLHVSFQRRR